MNCPACGSGLHDPGQGKTVTCANQACETLLWSHEGGLFFVPDLKEFIDEKGQRRQGFFPARFEDQASWFHDGAPIRTRLDADLEFIDGLRSVEDGEYVPLAATSDPSRRLNLLRERLRPFGLNVSRLLETEELERHEPILIHGADQSLEDRFPSFRKLPEDPTPALDESIHQDEGWPVWEQSLKLGFAGVPLFTEQLECLERVLSAPRSFTMVGLKTGFGKSRIAQASTHTLRSAGKGPALMVSPLIALMDDQRRVWNDMSETLEVRGERGLRAHFLTDAEPLDERAIQKALLDDEVDLLCCSPEKLISMGVVSNNQGKTWLETFQSMPNPFSLFIIDEAHTIADWGASIRPEFQLLDTIKRVLLRREPSLRMLLMSATISDQEEDEFVRMFVGPEGRRVMRNTGPPYREGSTINEPHTKTRPDLMFDFEWPMAQDQDLSFVRPMEEIHEAKEKMFELGWTEDPDDNTPYNESGAQPVTVVFTQKKVDAESGALRKAVKNLPGVDARLVKTYTGGTGAFQRIERLDEVIQDRLQYLLATSAFGMGVDKPNLWLTGFVGFPQTLKLLYQSFGRSSRAAVKRWGAGNKDLSGLCIGRFSGERLPFKPSLGPTLSAERLWSLFHSPVDFDPEQEHGVILLDIWSDINPRWHTSSGLHLDEEDVDEEEDIESDLHALIGGARAYWEEAFQRDSELAAQKLKEQRQRQQLLNLRLWLLACLERTGKLHVLGVHPRRFNIEEGGVLSFSSMVAEAGYLKAAERAAELHPSASGKVLAIGLSQDVESFEELNSWVKEGIEILKARYEKGAEEIATFRKRLRKQSECIRKLLAPCIGQPAELELSCIETIGTHAPVMPCSVCRKEPRVVELNIPPGPLFITPDVLNALATGTALDIVDQPKWSRIKGAPLSLRMGAEFGICKREFLDGLPSGILKLFLSENGGTARECGTAIIKEDCLIVMGFQGEEVVIGEGSHVEWLNGGLILVQC